MHAQDSPRCESRAQPFRATCIMRSDWGYSPYIQFLSSVLHLCFFIYVQIMLCLKSCRSAHPCTILYGLLPPTTALSRFTPPETLGFQSFEQFWKIYRHVTAKYYPSCMPQRCPPLLSPQSQGQSVHNTTRKGYHQLGLAQSALLPSRLSPLKLLRSFHKPASAQSSIRSCLIHRNLHFNSHATAHDPIAILLQPLDSSSRLQSVRRGFAITLPILIIYLFLYLLNFLPLESKSGRQYKSTIDRFWNYQRREGFQNVASLGTYVTSQFTHVGLKSLVIDSLVLIGVASILGSVFNRRTFFAIYVLGGVLAAAADCAWARFTNPCRNLTQAQLEQVLASDRLIDEARTKMAKLSASIQVFSMKALVELLSNEEFRKQSEVLIKYERQSRDWDRWTRPNQAANGSLICLCMPTTRWGIYSIPLSCNQNLLRD